MTAVLYSAGVNVMRISTLPLAGTTPVKQPLQQKHMSINFVIFIHTHMYKHGTCTSMVHVHVHVLVHCTVYVLQTIHRFHSEGWVTL